MSFEGEAPQTEVVAPAPAPAAEEVPVMPDVVAPVEPVASPAEAAEGDEAAPPATTDEAPAAEAAEAAAATEASPTEEAPAATASPAAAEPKKDWGGWGSLPEGFEENPTEPVERQAAPLLDELAHEQIDENTATVEITGPDGYKYPPLTEAGADVLQRLWSGQLPANREQAVRLWEGRVRVAVQMNLAIPQAPRMPKQELLMRPAAAKTTQHNTDMSAWVVPEEEESPEIKEWRERGEQINPETVASMLKRRSELRAQRNYKEADALRDDLCIMGVEFNDVLSRWRCNGQEGSFEGAAPPVPTAEDASRPPVELQDIDMPGRWEEFLQLPDPKVLAVGPRCPPNGKRAWGAGGKNWGTHDEASAVDQAMNNCAQQGVNRPKIIWPPHLAGVPTGGGKGFGGGGGGFKGKGGKEGGKFGGKGGKYGEGGKYGDGGKYGKGGQDSYNNNNNNNNGRGNFYNNNNNGNNGNNNGNNNNPGGNPNAYNNPNNNNGAGNNNPNNGGGLITPGSNPSGPPTAANPVGNSYGPGPVNTAPQGNYNPAPAYQQQGQYNQPPLQQPYSA